jgi:hypothetical protein
MECSICFGAIEKSVTTLSCGHHFHLGCIGRWVIKNESCPLCRHEMEEHEKIAEDVEEEEDEFEYDDDEGSEGSEDSDEPGLNWAQVNGHWVEVNEGDKYHIPEFNAENHAFWAMRNMFESLESGEEISAPAEKMASRPIVSYRSKRIIRRGQNGRTIIERHEVPVYETALSNYRRANKVQFRVEESREDEDDDGYLSA